MTTILTKKKDSSGVPATADITSSVGGAELAVNTADKRLYTKNSSNVIVEVGTNPASLNLNADLTNTSGNLVVDPATQIFEIKGSGSTEGQIQLNCAVNSHGQIITAADHGVSATNTLTLPGGDTIGNANATLVSDTGTQTLTNKTIDTAVSVSAAGAITSGTIVSDQDGNLRDIPVSQNISGNYTLAIGDAGNQINVNASNAIITVPTGVFGVGDIISLISVNGCTATIACTAVNAVKAGDLAATASHTLDANGVASIMFSYSADLAVLTGNIS
tara:strand:- start:4531 stop:5355 length:825 start_codon:yes stop_codon:yes gene_type:complete